MLSRLNIFLLLATSFLFSCNIAGEQVTAAEASAFAITLEKDAHRNRVGFISENIIVPAFLERAKETPGISYNDAMEKDLIQQLSSKLIEKNLTGALAANGSFKKVRVYEVEGRQRVIFRAYGEDLNYLDMELEKRAGKVGIADFFVYRTGNWFSYAWAGTISQLRSKKGIDDFEIIGRRMTEVNTLIKLEDYAAAKKAFESLPGYLQSAKSAEMTYLIILSALGDRDYLREIETFEKKYEKDPYTDINYFDLHYFNKDFYAALKSINKVDSLVGGDPFINYYRGLVYNSLGDTKLATVCFEKLLKDEPEFADGYLELFAVYNKRDKDKAKEYFSLYRKQETADTLVVAYFEKANPYLKK
jgi:tetratricopeptide (TPR) repeat protein